MRSVLLVSLIVLSTAGAARAQQPASTIRGQVFDPQHRCDHIQAVQLRNRCN